MGTAVSYYGQFSDSGSRNSFYTVKNSKYGFKSFTTQNLARFSNAVQSRLASDNLTPRVYSPVGRIRIPVYHTKSDGKGGMKTIQSTELSEWGYLTEIAKPYYCPNRDEYMCADHCFYEGGCRNYDKINHLIDRIEECGITYTDAHNGNLGWVIRKKKRVLVVIDIGRESIGDYDDSLYPNVDMYDDYASYGQCDCTECRRHR